MTDAVHAKGGRIFAQLWHVGRMSHTSIQPGNIAPVSAGTVQAVNTTVFALTESGEPGPVVPSQPRALETAEVRRVTADFVHSARLAMEAGFDGVEIMAANGFIFDQFLSSELNPRTDEYGGSVENRQRFLLETVDAISAAIGSNKVGLRISPFGRIYDRRLMKVKKRFGPVSLRPSANVSWLMCTSIINLFIHRHRYLPVSKPRSVKLWGHRYCRRRLHPRDCRNRT